MMIFSDYRMVYKFAEECGPDIDKHQCGRLEDDDEVSGDTWCRATELDFKISAQSCKCTHITGEGSLALVGCSMMNGDVILNSLKPV